MIVALDATPLTVATGGVARYTAELARALAVAFEEVAKMFDSGSAGRRVGTLNWPIFGSAGTLRDRADYGK